MGLYKMPEVSVGQLINWYPDGEVSGTPHAGIVTSIGFDSICVSLVEPNSYNMLIRDGVRHVTDERAKAPELLENGAWDYTKTDKKLFVLQKRMAELSETVEKLIRGHQVKAS